MIMDFQFSFQQHPACALLAQAGIIGYKVHQSRNIQAHLFSTHSAMNHWKSCGFMSADKFSFLDASTKDPPYLNTCLHIIKQLVQHTCFKKLFNIISSALYSVAFQFSPLCIFPAFSTTACHLLTHAQTTKNAYIKNTESIVATSPTRSTTINSTTKSWSRRSDLMN